MFPWKVVVSNASLTDNGDGTATLTTGAGSGVTAVGDCTTGACFTAAGTGTTLTPPADALTFDSEDNLFTGVAPNLGLDPDTGTAFIWHVDSGGLTSWFGQGSTRFLQFFSNGDVGLPGKLNCAVVSTLGDGRFSCSPAGAGAGTVTSITAGTGLTGGTITTSGTIALDTPVSVANGGTGAASLTDGGILLGSGTGAITALGVATNGQLPIGDGTTDPVLATLTGTADEITITNGAGTITVDIPDPLIVSKGGTGAASLTDGGLLLGSGTGALTALGVAANGQIPIGDGTTDPVLATITGTANQVVVTNGAGTITLSTPQDIATTSAVTFTDITSADTSPSYVLDPATGTSGGLHMDPGGTVLWLGQGSTHFLRMFGAGNLELNATAYADCTLKTNVGGRLLCGSDATGAAGSGDITDVNEGTAIDVTSSGGPAPTVNWDSTEVEATTWGAGGNSSNAWTFNLSGTDPVLTAVSNGLTLTGDWQVADTSPHVEYRDTSDNVAYMQHLDTAETHKHFTLWRGTDTGSGFAATTLLQKFDDNNDLLLPQVSREGSGVVSVLTNGTLRSRLAKVAVALENVAAADDNMPLGQDVMSSRTVRGLTCRCIGTCTTRAEFRLEDDAGNAMTHTTTSCAVASAIAAYVPVTAGGSLSKGEGLQFDVLNTPSPATDEYSLEIYYSVE